MARLPMPLLPYASFSELDRTEARVISVMRKILKLFGKKSHEENDLVAKIVRQLVFEKSTPLTLGVECEFGLVDLPHCNPVNVALEIVKDINDPSVQHELYQHMIEISTGVCATVQQVEKDLNGRLGLIRARLPGYNAAILGIGNLPSLTPEQLAQVETDRYKSLRERRKALYERFTTLGMHIHIGMRDRASCIRFHNFYMHLLPHLLALSASSPFEFGRDTGFASIRPSVTESVPIAGLPYHFDSWQNYSDLCIAMAQAGSITDLKDLWWDLRPCPRYGTLEIRICDQPATLAEVVAISAFVHCLGHWFAEHQEWLDEVPRPNNWLMRENKWRAMRYGLDADIVTNSEGGTIPIRQDILQWIERLQPFYKKFGYRPYQATLMAILEKGNSAERQRRVFQATNSLEAVYEHCIDELAQGVPQWEHVKTLEKAKA